MNDGGKRKRRRKNRPRTRAGRGKAALALREEERLKKSTEERNDGECPPRKKSTP